MGEFGPMRPLGLKPRWIVEEQRMGEIAAAMSRYSDAGLPCPAEWIEEMNELSERWVKRDAAKKQNQS